MRSLSILLLCVVMAGCASTKRAPDYRENYRPINAPAPVAQEVSHG
jgi:hypothetical protein